MTLNSFKDTIVALATARATSAIAMIRVSGEQAIGIADDRFSVKGGIIAAEPRKVRHGFFIDDQGRIIDEVIIIKYARPFSYTGQDMVEISCHGSLYIVDQILHCLIECGCRLAEAGEFTQRAFINGKMDLIQAEAVADIIGSNTSKSLGQAMTQVQGTLSKKLQDIQRQLLDSQSLLELELDFHEDEEFVDRNILFNNLLHLQQELGLLSDSFKYGRVLREGVHIAIVGKPNVGKSSLLNCLLKIDRAIVSDIPGTTRDSLEEQFNIDGYLFKVTDTAGLRQAKDPIEKLGIERTRAAMQQADILLLVLDGSVPIGTEDEYLLQECLSMHKELLIVLNKKDIGCEQKQHRQGTQPPRIAISCKTEDGLQELEQYLIKLVMERKHPQLGLFIDKARHWQSLVKAKEHLHNAVQSLKCKYSAEFIALDLRAALNAIGEITGQITSQDILNNIFAKFCIGK
jgi:tRNA modification GTPase